MMAHAQDEERRGISSLGVVDDDNDDDTVRSQSGLFISRAVASACSDWCWHEPLRTSLPCSQYKLHFASSPQLHHREMKKTEALLAAEMNKLSVEEMSKALDDVHCVGETVVETPEMVRHALVTFGEEATVQATSIYEIALQQNRKYVEGEAFRMKFLRCNLFEIKSSVSQMMKFLQYKANYFGINMLGRDIFLSDLTNEERDLLQSGLVHVQQCKDRCGRNVLWFFNGLLGRWTKDVMIRIMYFVNFNILLSDSELQKRGTVFIYYDTAQPGNNLIHRLKMSEHIEILSFMASVPCRYSSTHICLKRGKDNLALNNALVASVTRMVSHYTRVRTRLHYGSDMELQYTLQDHGISLKTCPADINGVVLPDVVKIWYKESVENGLFKGHSNSSGKRSDSSSKNGSFAANGASSNVLLGVRRNDVVLLGRGTVVQFRPANIRFRKFVAEHRDAYDHARRAAKGRIVAELSQTLKSNGVRFLKAGRDQEWVECNEREVEKTIAQQFRSARKEKRRVDTST